MLHEITKLYLRDLKKLDTEIRAYKNEENLWKIEGEILNSGGNLCLHICGNLQHFIGHHYGKTGYVRDREAEFGDKNIPRSELLARIENTSEVVRETIPTLSGEFLERRDPQQMVNFDMTNREFIMHLFAHLSYHLGQINYHRRLLDK